MSWFSNRDSCRGTGIGRDFSRMAQVMARGIARLPGVSSPTRSGPALASVALDERWSGLRDGAYVVIDKETQVLPHAHDRDRELSLWVATSELLERAATKG